MLLCAEEIGEGRRGARGDAPLCGRGSDGSGGPSVREAGGDCRREGRLAGRAACGDDVYADGVTARRPQLLLAACSIPRRSSKRMNGSSQ